MTESTPIFVECPKCGAEETSANPTIKFTSKNGRWEESEKTIQASILTTFVLLPAGVKCVCERSVEHLHRKCLVCGYYWSTETVDRYLSSKTSKVITEVE